MCVCVLVAQSHPTLCDSCQVPLSIGFSRQECWSGLPLPPPGDLPDLGIKPRSLKLQADSLLSEPQGSPLQVRLWEKVHNRPHLPLTIRVHKRLQKSAMVKKDTDSLGNAVSVRKKEVKL